MPLADRLAGLLRPGTAGRVDRTRTERRVAPGGAPSTDESAPTPSTPSPGVSRRGPVPRSGRDEHAPEPSSGAAAEGTRPTPPRLSADDVAAARRKALTARRTRADVKRQVRSGALHPGEVLDLAFADTELGRAVARMTVGDLMLSLPGMGRVLADRTLVELGISGNRRLRALGEHQRAALRVTWDGSVP